MYQTSGSIQLQQHVQTLVELRTGQATCQQPCMHAGVPVMIQAPTEVLACANLYHTHFDMFEIVSVLCRARLNFCLAHGWVLERLVGVNVETR
jgi:hypothetical protein